MGRISPKPVTTKYSQSLVPDYFATKPKNYEPGVTILPVNDPCDDGSTREPNPNEELKMSKNVLETFHIHEEGSYKTIVLQRETR